MPWKEEHDIVSFEKKQSFKIECATFKGKYRYVDEKKQEIQD